MDPQFLTVAELIEIHEDQIRRYGGAPGLRDRGLLESAVAAPSAMFGGRYLHRGLSEMAAAQLFHLVANHPFVDGNKRSAAVATLVFLDLNHATLDADEHEFENMVRAIAEGKAGKIEATAFFRDAMNEE